MIEERSRSLIGKSWIARSGATIFVYEEIKGSQHVGKSYIVACSICSKDSELWPEIHMNRTSVRDEKLSCSCSIKVNYSIDQNVLRAYRKAKDLGIEVLEVEIAGNTKNSRIKTYCNEHGQENHCLIKTLLERKSCCMAGGVENSLNSRLISEEDASNSFMSTGKFTEGTEFKRVGLTGYWEVHCKKCKQDQYAADGIKSVWVCIGGSLSSGVSPCRCSVKHYWTKEEYLKRISMTGWGFAGWDGEYIGNSQKDKFFARCEKHGIWSVSISAIVNGRGCPGCARSGFDRTSEGFIYCLKSEDSSMLKVGITNNPKIRFMALRTDTPFEFSVVGHLKMNGHEAAQKEKSIHGKYMSAELSGFCGCTEWLRYDDEIVSMFV